MTQAQENAINRACGHENLIAELMDALADLLPAYRAAVKLIDLNHDDALTVKAHNALVKARSQQ